MLVITPDLTYVVTSWFGLIRAGVSSLRLTVDTNTCYEALNLPKNGLKKDLHHFRHSKCTSDLHKGKKEATPSQIHK